MYTLVQGSLGLGEEEKRCATYALESLLWFGDVGGLHYDALALAHAIYGGHCYMWIPCVGLMFLEACTMMP